MHIYIYDKFLADRRYSKTLAKIETRITDLGLNGKIIRLGMISSIGDSIASEIKKGAKTIVLVGGGIILNKGISAYAALVKKNLVSNNIPVGFIPVGKEMLGLARFLGLGMEEQSCNVLSQRRVSELDLGQANDRFFIFNASITSRHTTVEIDKNYTIEIKDSGTISILNLPYLKDNPLKDVKCDPADGLLELLIQANKNNKLLSFHNKEGLSQSIINFTDLRILNKDSGVLLDDKILINPPVDIKPSGIKIGLIVGKDRLF